MVPSGMVSVHASSFAIVTVTFVCAVSASTAPHATTVRESPTSPPRSLRTFSAVRSAPSPLATTTKKTVPGSLSCTVRSKLDAVTASMAPVVVQLPTSAGAVTSGVSSSTLLTSSLRFGGDSASSTTT